MESIIPLLQVSIYVIIGIMILLVFLYIYLLKPKTIKEEKVTYWLLVHLGDGVWGCQAAS